MNGTESLVVKDKERIITDNELRVSQDGSLWGTFSTLRWEETLPADGRLQDEFDRIPAKLAEGEVINDFPDFLRNRFLEILDIEIPGKGKPFKKIVTIGYRPVMLSDLWDAWQYLNELGYVEFDRIKIAQGAKNGEPWSDFKNQMLHINSQVDKIRLIPDLVERKKKLLTQKSRNTLVFLVFQEHNVLKEAISAIEKRIDAEIAICDIKLKQATLKPPPTLPGNNVPVPYSLKAGQEKYCEIAEPEEGREIISHFTLEDLARKLWNGCAKWLRNKATSGQVKLKLNPRDGKYWIYLSEKEHFTKKPIGRPRKI